MVPGLWVYRGLRLAIRFIDLMLIPVITENIKSKCNTPIFITLINGLTHSLQLSRKYWEHLYRQLFLVFRIAPCLLKAVRNMTGMTLNYSMHWQTQN
jgi:hypothetical protein